MKEQLVSYELAKLAKEKEFDWETSYYYTPDKELLAYAYYEFGRRNSKLDECITNTECTVPTQSLLHKWFRDEHKIYIFAFPVVPERFYFSITKQVTNKIEKLYESPYDPTQSKFAYEEALEQGLLKAMTLI